ncbi:high mobility group box domain-containing protein, partial [Vararia minispora EC-137]
PRPPNPFMLFRQDYQTRLKDQVRDSRNVSTIAGEIWRSMDEKAREPYVKLAEQKKAEHKEKYPDYRFQP